MMYDLTPIIGENLAKLRRKKRLSLDKLSELSGISKAMIGQIERGESNPTVNTLWKIASGLRVSFGKLIDTNQPATELVRLDDITPIIDNDGITLLPMFSFDYDKGFEIFSITMAPHCVHEAAGHVGGSEEYVLSFEGDLEIIVESETYTLAAGDAIRFKADKTHTYRNPSDKIVRFQNILYYS
jgi:transcriptional regulator with XRE-family HTH domain